MGSIQKSWHCGLLGFPLYVTCYFLDTYFVARALLSIILKFLLRSDTAFYNETFTGRAKPSVGSVSWRITLRRHARSGWQLWRVMVGYTRWGTQVAELALHHTIDQGKGMEWTAPIIDQSSCVAYSIGVNVGSKIVSTLMCVRLVEWAHTQL